MANECIRNPGSLAVRRHRSDAGHGRYRCVNGELQHICTNAGLHYWTRIGQSRLPIVWTSKCDTEPQLRAQDLANIAIVIFQCTTIGPAATSRRIRLGRRGRTVSVSRASRSNRCIASTIRSTHIRIRFGIAAILWTGRLSTEHHTSLCARNRREFHWTHCICHRLGSSLRRSVSLHTIQFRLQLPLFAIFIVSRSVWTVEEEKQRKKYEQIEQG